MQTLSSSVNEANTVIVLTTQALPAMLALVVLLGVALLLNPLVTAALILLALVIGLILRPLSSGPRLRAGRFGRP